MTVRIRAFDHTLVGNHVYSREEVLGSNPTTPKPFFPKGLRSRQPLLRSALSKGHDSRYITLSLKGTYSVRSFYELKRMFWIGLQHFLR